jgi:antitoxin MazE
MPQTPNESLTTKLRPWGNSLGVRIPRRILRRAMIAEGSTLKIEQTARGILLSPAKKTKRKRQYTLRELCEGMTPAKSRPEFDWGGSVGSEVI